MILQKSVKSHWTKVIAVLIFKLDFEAICNGLWLFVSVITLNQDKENSPELEPIREDPLFTINSKI